MPESIQRLLNRRAAQVSCEYRIQIGYCLQHAADGSPYCYYHDKVATGVIAPGESRYGGKTGTKV